MRKGRSLQTFEFKVLCVDEGTCDFVRGLMADMDVKDLDSTRCHDHIGTKDFEDVGQAAERMDRLQRDAGDRITNAILARIR